MFEKTAPAPFVGFEPQSSSTEFPKEGMPMSTMPTRGFEPEAPRTGSAVIGKSVVIKGQIYSREDLVVDGELEGTIEAHEHRITVGPNGKIQANLKGREVVLLGQVHGNVEATDKIEIRKDARLVGDIKTARIVIEDGAYFKGSIDISKAEPKAAPQPQRPAGPAPESAPAAAPPPPAANPASLSAERKR